MKNIDTPAGKFQIFRNGAPLDFEAKLSSPYTYHDVSGTAIPILACYQVSLSTRGLSVGDVVEAKFEHGTLVDDGGGEGMHNAVGYVGDYAIGIGAADTHYPEWHMNHCQLPYAYHSTEDSGFVFHIVDDPQKYTAHAIQQTISFVVAWEASRNAYAWDIVSFMTS